MRNSQRIQEYRFHTVTVKVQGLGVYCGQARLAALCAGMDDVAKLQAINAEAWKQRRQAERLCARYSNVTVHGNLQHDLASQHYDVAAAVCSASWKRLCQLREGS